MLDPKQENELQTKSTRRKSTSSAGKSLSVPSRIFVMGQIVARYGGPAIVATLPKRFKSLGKENSKSKAKDRYQGDLTAARKLTDQYGGESVLVENPLEGFMGFGISTAEFLLQYHQLFGSDVSVWEVWKEYMGLHYKSSRKPSGYGLIGQSMGGIQWIEARNQTLTNIEGGFSSLRFLVFSTSTQYDQSSQLDDKMEDKSLRKLAMNLEGIVLNTKIMLDHGKFEKSAGQTMGEKKITLSGRFGEAMNQYANSLRDAGLEHPAIREDRKYFSQFPWVSGVKGCEDIGANAILVLTNLNSEGDVLKNIKKICRERKMSLIHYGPLGTNGLEQDLIIHN